VAVPGTSTICEGSSTTLRVGNVPLWSKTIWNNGDTSKIISVSPLVITSYFVRYLNNNCANSDSLTINVLPRPKINIPKYDTICVGESTILHARGGTTYKWFNGFTDSDIVVSPPSTSTYWVVGYVNGCVSDTQRITVIVTPKPIAAFIANPSGGLIPLTVKFTNLSTNSSGFLWLFGDGDSSTLFSPQHIYQSKGKFTITLIAKGIKSCSDIFQMDIITEDKYIIYIPNVFSPNGDQKNDLFEIKMGGVKSLEGEIYNHWGELVYSWRMPDGKWWDGNYGLIQVPEGVYIYILNINDINDEKHILKGKVSVVR
jgi:gliding motility-associated-like protein